MSSARDTADDIQKQIDDLRKKQKIVLARAEREKALEAKANEKTLVEASPVKAAPVAFRHQQLRAISPPPKPAFTNNKTLLPSQSQKKWDALPTRSNSSLASQPKPYARPKPTASHTSQAQSQPRSQAQAGPSTLASNIIARNNEEDDDEGSGAGSSSGRGKAKAKGPKRDEETLRLIESFEFGPREFKTDPEGKEEWQFVEPNSGIRLKSRTQTHAQVQADLTMRFYVTSSQLYSIVTLARDRSHFDVPLDGPWVTIMVVAGKSLLTTKGGERALSPASQKRAEKKWEAKRKAAEAEKAGEAGEGSVPKRNKMLVDVPDEDDYNSDDNNRGRSANKGWKSGPRKFCKLKLTALPSRRRNDPGAGGDALLNMLLFEADGVMSVEEGGEKKYKGGSGGAYEKWWKLDVGDVIGIIDPKVLKPHGKGPANGLQNPLGLTINSPNDIFLIGTAKDIAICKTVKKSGWQCEEHVDTRYAKNCEYHIANAVKGLRGGRAEFASSTGGFDMGIRSRGSAAGPSSSTTTGLKPRDGSVSFYKSQLLGNDAGGQMYMVGGRVISDKNSGGFSQEFVGEKIGREKDRAMKRKREQANSEAALNRLLDGGGAEDSAGGRYLKAARKAQNGDKESGDLPNAPPLSKPFSNEAINRIGFNPSTLSQGDKPAKNDAIASLKRANVPVKLGHLPGPKNRSSLKAPLVPMQLQAAPMAAAEAADPEDGFVDLDSD